MTRIYIGIGLLVPAQIMFAQLSIMPIHDSRAKTSEKTTAAAMLFEALPFWDDFSISTHRVDSVRVWGTDTLLQWDINESRGVFVNATLAINPPTYNVATFDGLNESGAFYSTTDQAVGLTDELVSYPINLTGTNNVYLSFYWQAGGYVEKPEAGDSLRLQLLDTGAVWRTVWLKEGGEGIDETQFEQEVIKVINRYVGDSLRFRFQAFGDQDGPFDAWHIDWVYLNKNRTTFDVGYLDRAFTGQLTSPLFPFQSVPSLQFRGDPDRFIGDQRIYISNLDKTDVQPINYRHLIRELISGQALFLNPDELVAPLLQANTIQVVPLDNITIRSLPAGDSLIFQSEIMILDAGDEFLDGTDIFLRVNDTIRENYTLHDYYAFDDGTAEYAAGTNIRNGQVAVQFWVNQPDTLTHVDINFPNISPSQDGSTVELRIFDELSEEGLRSSQQIIVRNNIVRDSFSRYALTSLLIISDTFYIAYRQSVRNFLAIGFDRSNPAASRYIFENREGEWIQNISLQGALMVRPIFKSDAQMVTGQPETGTLSARAYPNPTSGPFHIEGGYDYIEVLDMSGHVIMRERQKNIHAISSKVMRGMYLLRIFKSNSFKSQKIIVK